MMKTNRKLFLLAVVFFTSVLMVFAGCDKNNEGNNGGEEDGDVLTFMTYNIHIANPPSQPASVVDVAAIAKAINSVKPDFVALQEVDRFTDRSGKDLDQAAALAELTGLHYQFFKAIDRSNGEYGVAILSKYPIEEHHQVLLPIVPGSGAEIRTVGWIRVKLANGEDFVFASTHLDHLSDENRELQSRELLKALKSYQRYHIVLGGDFNMDQSNDVWDTLKAIFNVPCTNCPSTHSAINPRTAIDFLILNNTANNAFKIKSYETFPETYASDHLPVVMKVQYKD
ncbi:endonuclease/exonuclease/phosphatase family protein [Sphingobacterium sp. DN00404]|uniref:Endonuclease/exonuclease/phosphatase family protein n=1 Tax=Sphingobacterium micropteri TaxID=2763501 RepID=A0ABR7YRZ4_9SPHI|nr:endonuclease/exonuclease/phosphatase family protein [Sphingobacterium micropteri]MBD1433951.1 endonuclease/exonuclease/phosphatase family protein [Sphingobacterium micropteri]